LKSGEIVWTPDQYRAPFCLVDEFREWVQCRDGEHFDDYAQLHRWSVGELDRFWLRLAEFFDVELGRHWTEVRTGASMRETQWFPGAKLNYVAHALRPTGSAEALVSISEARPTSRLSRDELRSAVARCRTGLRRLGVGPGDTVAGYLPNTAEAVIAYLAVASLGAIWSSCAPELGTAGVIDRLGQIGPKVFIAADGYVYGSTRSARSNADFLPWNTQCFWTM